MKKRVSNSLLVCSVLFLLFQLTFMSASITSWAEATYSQQGSTNTCCSSLDLTTLALEVPCIHIGEGTFSLSLSYSGGTLFKLEDYALLDNSPCSTECCGNFDVETWLVSLPCVLVGETSLWTTFSLVANSEGLFFDLLDYGLNPPSPVAEIKEITLDTSQDSSSFFSFVTDNYADDNTFDVFAEPWCTDPPRLCGHFVALGEVALENVSAAEIPADTSFPTNIECQDLAVGDTCIFKNADDSYTAATIASHVMPASCVHKITLRYKSLSQSTTSSCDVTEPQHAVGDTLWVHNLPMDTNELWIPDAPLALGKDGSIYYSAHGGQVTWDSSRIYAINKTDGSLKWKTEPLAIWHLNSNIVVGDDGTIYVLSYTKLYSIDPNTGAFNWVWEVPHTIGDYNTYGEVGGLALANNGDLIFKTNGSGSYYRALYCVGPDGQTKWHHFIGAEGTPITIGYNGTIYDIGHESWFVHDLNRWLSQTYLYAYNPDTCNEIWKVPVDNLNSGYDNIIVADDGDLIWRDNANLVRFDAADGHTIWKTAAESNHYSKVLDPDGFVYLYDQWAWTAVFNSQTGVKKESRISVTSWPTIDSRGRLCGTMGSESRLSVNDADGNVVWKNSIDRFYGGSLAISTDKVIYIANDKKVYALQGDATLASSGWPKYSHDNRNTSNVNKH